MMGSLSGSRLFISQPAFRNQLVTVTAVEQGSAKFLAPGATTTPVRTRLLA